MAGRSKAPPDAFARHDAELRDPADIVAFWEGAGKLDPGALEVEADGDFWELLRACGITLLVSREYEHLLVALSCDAKGPRVSFMRLPHPSGIATRRDGETVFVASTRNPNQLYELVPATALLPRLDVEGTVNLDDRPLVPRRSWFLPGCTYLHDLAFVGAELHATSVGQNAIVRLGNDGAAARVWWPRCIETKEGPIFGRNHLQLNSIAAGDTLAQSYFSASADEITELRPGDPEFPVDGRGVVFSGATREPIARGLTRPHSARLHEGRVWVDNSGYGEVGVIDGARLSVVQRLPGWTRGLGFHGDLCFVGISRVLPRFRAYAPGLDVDRSRCGVYVLEARSGRILGSLVWPRGNQIFAVEWIRTEASRGLAFRLDKTSQQRKTTLFYAFQTK